MRLRLASLAVCLALAAIGPVLLCAATPDTFYIGTWKIASATVAPWAEPSRKPDLTEMKSLVGKVVNIMPHQITGPHALACKGPNYRVEPRRHVISRSLRRDAAARQ